MLSKKTVGKENITNDGPRTLIFFSTQNHAYSILVLAPSTTGAANVPVVVVVVVVMKHLENCIRLSSILTKPHSSFQKTFRQFDPWNVLMYYWWYFPAR